MRLFFVFAPTFLEWPLAIARELKARIPESNFSGLATGPRVIFSRAARSKEPGISPIAYLDDLENEWISTPCDEARLMRYESLLSPGTTRRIVTADRQIGIGLVSGGLIPRTKLMDLTEDFEVVRRYVLGLLEYLFESFTLERPSLVFLHGSAGAISAAISEVCGHLKIPFARLTPSRIGSLHVMDDSPEGLLNPVARLFNKAIGNPSMLDSTLSAARKYVKDFRMKPEQPGDAVYVFENFRKARALSGIVKQLLSDFRGVASETIRRPKRHLRATTAWRLMLHHLKVRLRARHLIKKGPFHELGNLPDRSFAYFPLHLDPEASTMVLAPMHTDQVAVIEALVKSLPLSMDLVVKEHIPNLGSRPQGMYKRLKKMPGVFLASPLEDTMSLIKRAALVCTITGTVAWEAIVLRRPALIIGGSPFLTLGEGFVHCSDLSRLPEAVSKGLMLPPVDDKRLALYVAALMEQSFDFPTELLWGKVTKETVRHNPEILNSICDRLLAIGNTYETRAANVT